MLPRLKAHLIGLEVLYQGLAGAGEFLERTQPMGRVKRREVGTIEERLGNEGCVQGIALAPSTAPSEERDLLSRNGNDGDIFGEDNGQPGGEKGLRGAFHCQSEGGEGDYPLEESIQPFLGIGEGAVFQHLAGRVEDGSDMFAMMGIEANDLHWCTSCSKIGLDLRTPEMGWGQCVTLVSSDRSGL
jgi:hypothetical protein